MLLALVSMTDSITSFPPSFRTAITMASLCTSIPIYLMSRLAAAMSKKNVPADVVTDQAKATYVLKSAPIEVKTESTGGKIARCLFASCAGIEDKGNVSVQLIETSSTRMIWAYSVNKQRGGSKNEQSMAEAVAKHFKEFLEKK
jgi:hypothetical protein